MRQNFRTIIKIATTLFLLLALTSVMRAQSNSTESPYSRFGFGRLDRQTPHALRGMGGLSSAVRDRMIINPMNPASYTAVDSMTFLFDFGVSVGMNMLAEGNKTDPRMIGNFDYVSMLFPLGKHFAASLGLLPFSNVGYRYGSREEIDNTTGQYYARSYKGKGSLQEVYFGLSYEPIPYWSVGANVSYLFGNLKHERSILFDINDSYNPTFQNTLQVRSVGVRVGTQGIIPMATEGHRINLGATYSPSLPMWTNEITRNTNTIAGQTSTIVRADTVVGRGSYVRPHSIGFGVSYEIQDKLLLGADVQYNRWSKAFLNTQNTDYRGADQWQVALGVAWTPDSRSSRYGQKIQYKAGLNAENAYLRIADVQGVYNSYYQIGGSLGLGFPLVDRRSNVDVSLGYSYLMPSVKNALAEHYLMVSFALRFNEAWFKPIRLD